MTEVSEVFIGPGEAASLPLLAPGVAGRAPMRIRPMSLGTILLILLILLLVGALPTWHHSANWGYAPTGGLGLVLVIVVILLLLGRI